MEEAGWAVVRADDLAGSGMVAFQRGAVAALIDVCRAGYGVGGHAADALRHVESRLAARLRESR